MNAFVQSSPAPIYTWAAWISLIILETLCQVAVKLSGQHTGALELSLLSVMQLIYSPWLWVALACYVGSFLTWMFILQQSSLSRAFPTSAVVFVAVMGASWALFGEAFDWNKITGSVFIVLGILMLGPDAADNDESGMDVDIEKP